MNTLLQALAGAIFPALIIYEPSAAGIGAVVVALSFTTPRGLVLTKTLIVPYAILLLYAALALQVYITSQASLLYWAGYVILPIAFFVVATRTKVDNFIFLFTFLLVFFLVLVLLFTFRDVSGGLTLSISELRILHRGKSVYKVVDPARSFFVQNNTSMAVYFITPLLISLVLWHMKRKVTLLAIAAFCAFLLILLNTRSAYGAMLLIFTIFFFYHERRPLKGILSILLIVVTVSALGYWFLASYSGLIGIQLERLTLENLVNTLNLRVLAWSRALEHIATNPWGYGHRFFFEQYGISTHSEYLGQLISLGVVGFVIYYGFIGYTVMKAFRSLQCEDQNTKMIASLTLYMLLSYLVIGFSEQLLLSARIWVIYLFIVVGLFYGHRARET